MVEALNERRILVDLAHASRRTFFDALEALDACDPPLPPVVTHTGVSGVHPSWRNLDDDQIRAIADRGGVIGIMYHRGFLGRPSWKVGAEAIVRHLEHAIAVGGEDVAALGSDWDGMIVTPRDMPTCLELPVLVDRMLARRWPEPRIRRVLGHNALRVVPPPAPDRPTGVPLPAAEDAALLEAAFVAGAVERNASGASDPHAEAAFGGRRRSCRVRRVRRGGGGGGSPGRGRRSRWRRTARRRSVRWSRPGGGGCGRPGRRSGPPPAGRSALITAWGTRSENVTAEWRRVSVGVTGVRADVTSRWLSSSRYSTWAIDGRMNRSQCCTTPPPGASSRPATPGGRGSPMYSASIRSAAERTTTSISTGSRPAPRNSPPCRKAVWGTSRAFSATACTVPADTSDRRTVS